MTLGELKIRADRIVQSDTRMRRAATTRAARIARYALSKSDQLEELIALVACYSGSLDFEAADKLQEYER